MDRNQSLIDDWPNQPRKVNLRCGFCGGYAGGIRGKTGNIAGSDIASNIFYLKNIVVPR